MRVAVVGAGAFGGWTALHLRRAGLFVTLLDAWGPGNARASSGGETRVIRMGYGPTRRYVDMAARALALWREWDRATGAALFHNTGVLWLAAQGDGFVPQSLPHLLGARANVELLTPAEAAQRWPQIDFDGIQTAVLERDGGYVLARRACEAVLREFVRIDGLYQPLAVSAIRMDHGRPYARLSDGSRLDADRFVCACGPWLGSLFPDVIGARVRPTRQEVFYFGTPAGDDRFLDSRLPVWIESGGAFMYGIPGNAYRGFKVADDARGPEFDPTSGDRTPSAEGAARARAYLSRRFPALADAPVLGAEVCQYEETPDGHFILDRHPAMPDVWIAGGGSGHGFKMGPAIGELLARWVREDAAPDPFFALDRLY